MENEPPSSLLTLANCKGQGKSKGWIGYPPLLYMADGFLASTSLRLSDEADSQ